MKNSFVIYADMGEALLSLDDADLRQMVTAIFDYHNKDTEPDFSGAMRSLWQMFRGQFQRDQERYGNVCDRNRTNGKKGGRPKNRTIAPKNPVGYLETQGNPRKPKKPDNDNDNDDDDIKESTLTSTKETAPQASLFSLPHATIAKPNSFKQWSEAEFKEQVYSFPEYAGIAEEFLRYWTEPDPSGKMRFQLGKTWETVRRLKTWSGRFSNRPSAYQKPEPQYEQL